MSKSSGRDISADESLRLYIPQSEDGWFVGDVNYHYYPAQNRHDIGIVIYAPERGKGYGKKGLRLLMERAFIVDGVSRLHNDFETARDAACRIHKAVGFRETETEDGLVEFELTREEFIRKLPLAEGQYNA